MTAIPALAVEDLSVEFRTRSGIVKVLEHVGFEVDKGETVALVGESGSGKSVTAFAVMGILDAAGKVTSGRAMFGGSDLLALSEGELAEQRGRELSMIFQNPRTALNPIRQVGQQIADVLVRHGGATRPDAPRAAVEMLKKVRIPDPERRAEAYPFELSGGMCQRIMIAIALACRPALLIADEPTTGPRRHHPGRDHGPDRRARRTNRAWRRSSSPTISRWPPNIATASSSCMPATSSNGARPGAVRPSAPSLFGQAAGRDAGRDGLACRDGLDPRRPAGSASRRPAALPLQRPLRAPDRRLRDPAAAATRVGERHVVACWHPL